MTLTAKPSVVATATSSPSPTAPALPPAMRNADTTGAEAAAKYTIAVLNHASSTADVAEWTRLTSPECETCVGFTSDITAAGPDPDGVVLVESSKPTEINPGAFYTVALIVSQEAYTRPDGSASEGGRFALLLALRFTDSWTVEAIDVGPSDAPWAS
ncbi:DUF6318 family protein [Cellulomonas dongxiuzhuiae]|uniref:DUF6318 family protein n=1 Tax=Cellulomonas dongxiuzhuiae TaxID=2819979 RepID=UPI001AAEC733|nr:DUF6318 family protein [Cellulomonas dongxiuzhuiae]MBO3089412.1 hypothetical protein [Cellulomonas dongxiuzhuiae]